MKSKLLHIIRNDFFHSKKGLLIKNQNFKAKLDDFIKHYIKPEYRDNFIKLLTSPNNYNSSTSLYDMINFQ